jgi:predicted RNase H-like nuclease (RuvC/YqgF family)
MDSRRQYRITSRGELYDAATLTPAGVGYPVLDPVRREIDQLKQAVKALSRRNDTLEGQISSLQKELRHERQARKEVELQVESQTARVSDVKYLLLKRIDGLEKELHCRQPSEGIDAMEVEGDDVGDEVVLERKRGASRKQIVGLTPRASDEAVRILYSLGASRLPRTTVG